MGSVSLHEVASLVGSEFTHSSRDTKANESRRGSPIWYLYFMRQTKRISCCTNLVLEQMSLFRDNEGSWDERALLMSMQFWLFPVDKHRNDVNRVWAGSWYNFCRQYMRDLVPRGLLHYGSHFAVQCSSFIVRFCSSPWNTQRNNR